jgi:alkanesulfonate monooxygenase SsuD/methylene tetrahydromethanopterin reductase-like flavin-dependent oxidoreductase (luciferase family)
MWSVEHTIETSASPEAIWKLWADVAGWPAWNSGVETIELIGPFAVGSRIVMRPPGDDPVELLITEANEPDSFVDAADGGDFVVTTFHRAERVDDNRTRIVYRMEITGQAADAVGPEIGPQISGDFPEVLKALKERAETAAP